MPDSFETPWAIAHQASLSMGFLRQESWSALPFPPPGSLTHPGIKPTSPALAGRFFTTESPGKPSFQLGRLKYRGYDLIKKINKDLTFNYDNYLSIVLDLTSGFSSLGNFFSNQGNSSYCSYLNTFPNIPENVDDL